jgi:hypothetical protein
MLSVSGGGGGTGGGSAASGWSCGTGSDAVGAGTVWTLAEVTDAPAASESAA